MDVIISGKGFLPDGAWSTMMSVALQGESVVRKATSLLTAVDCNRKRAQTFFGGGTASAGFQLRLDVGLHRVIQLMPADPQRQAVAVVCMLGIGDNVRMV